MSVLKQYTSGTRNCINLTPVNTINPNKSMYDSVGTSLRVDNQMSRSTYTTPPIFLLASTI